MLDTRPWLIRSAPWVALLLTGAVLQGCAPKAPPNAAGSQHQLFASDFRGQAKSCTVPKVRLQPGKPAEAAMKVGNDGGWCAIGVAQDGEPYAAGLLTTEPDHGKVYIHPVGNETRIDYTPDPGYRGADAFTVTLLPGRPALRVAVAVLP